MPTDAPIARQSIAEFLEALAQRSPAPGGGAVAALTGATGAALGAMALRYSTSESQTDASTASAITEAIVRADDDRGALLALADEDAKAYERVARAFALPRDAPERKEAIRSACAAACAPPAEVVRRAADLLERIAAVAPQLNANLASDLAICADLLLSAAQSGERLVRVNAKFTGDAGAAPLEAAKQSLCAARGAHARILAVADPPAA